MLRPLYIILFLIHSILCSSQDTINKACIDKNYIKSYFADTKDLAISPVKWDHKEWIGFVGFTGSTILLIKNEAPIYDWFQRNRSTATDNISKYGIQPFGNGIYSMSIMGTFYVHGLFMKNERSKKVAMLGAKAFLISGVLVHVPKYLFNRHRPYHDNPENPYLWEGPFADKYYKSFFSGHTTTIFAVATIVSSEYKDKPIVPLISYTIASAVGLSRINDETHWASDVFAGAVFGYAIGKLIYNKNNWGIDLTPYTNNHSSGIYISIEINQ